jgi:signal transduction histidine kinase
MSNAHAQHDLLQLAEEQAALRRVATLVASGTPANELFAAVTQEVGQLLQVQIASMGRYDPERAVTTVGNWSGGASLFEVGGTWQLGGKNIGTLVAETGRPARIDDYADVSGEIGIAARDMEFRSAVGTPIVVEGRTWGFMAVVSTREQVLPRDTETRLGSFTELVATAISNAATRSELIASRARIVAAGDEARRRIERDLHDGTQQRLLALALDLETVRATVPAELREAHAELERIEHEIHAIFADVRELSRGLHPPLLVRTGLSASLRELARRSPIPVELDIALEQRPPASIETATYYVVSEALTNAVKHSQASVVSVAVSIIDATLRVTIRDDGLGGATAIPGAGLVGLTDRVEALGGTLTFESPCGCGTFISVDLPRGAPA